MKSSMKNTDVYKRQQTIIAIENDKYNPTLELAMKLARRLGLHVDEIFWLEEDSPGRAETPRA